MGETMTEPVAQTNRDRLVCSLEVEYPSPTKELPKLSIKVYYEPGQEQQAVWNVHEQFLRLAGLHRQDLMTEARLETPEDKKLWTPC